MIGIWGPRARDVVAATTTDDLSNAALPFGRAITISIGGAPVLAQRITYVGELGYELYVPPEWAIQVWDRLRAAGEPHGLELGGYRALESLRMEKGYRYMGTDLTAATPPTKPAWGSAWPWTRASSSAAARSERGRARPAAADDPDRR